MGDAWVGVVGVLAGVLVGWGGTLFAERLSYQRESGERFAASRRQTYLEWLAASHELFDAVAVAHREMRANDLDPKSAADRLRGLATAQVQTRLEALRFVAGDDVAAGAAMLWGHLRRERVPLGQDVSGAAWRAWRETYWVLRREFVDAARSETGLEPLDWESAGISGSKRF